ncbi:MAG: M28 family peptidase, partial [Dehalococcoidia bacterium]|nr:M28 family peptidase [Dehalococcoidia bacterium]
MRKRLRKSMTMTWICHRKRALEAVRRPRLWRGIGVLSLFVTLSLSLAQVAVAAEPNRVLIQQFAELGDRSTGTSGCGKAADFIAKGFKDLGIERVGRQRFLLPVTQYQGAYLTVKGHRAPIKPLRLNALSPQVTSASGLKGPLYYVGSGQLHNFNGIKVEGSIILMELDSGKNWLNAAMLGARALIFVDRGPTSKWFFEDKRELTSIQFPRFWMPLSQARTLFGSFEAAAGGLVATGALLTSRGGWRRVQAENIYALIEGKDSDLKEQLLVVEAFYDSTALVSGMSPGADEATSIAALLNLARSLRDHPPGRSVLLMATSGHAQGLAGMREFIWPIRARSKERKKLRRELKERIKRAEEALTALESTAVFEQLDGESAERLRAALAEQVKSEVESLSQRLMQLRLGKQSDDIQALIRELADRRFLLRQLGWRGSYQNITFEERQVLTELIPAAIRGKQAVLDDAREQMKCLKSARTLRRLLSDYGLTAFISLHLSSHGDGVGGFNYGWLYDLKPQVNRTATYAPIDRILTRCSRQVEEQLGLPQLFRDTLRPSPLRPWQSYLPDHPALGGEVSALAGILGLSLVTTHDGRPLWGTPYDKPENVNLPYLEQQSRLISGLILKLTREPELVSDRLPLKGFSTLSGQANFIRQGELFPDQPAPGTL